MKLGIYERTKNMSLLKILMALFRKIDFILLFLFENKCDVLCLNETKIDHNVSDI